MQEDYVPVLQQGVEAVQPSDHGSRQARPDRHARFRRFSQIVPRIRARIRRTRLAVPGNDVVATAL